MAGWSTGRYNRAGGGTPWNPRWKVEQGSFVPLDANEEGWLESRVLPGFRVKEAWFTDESLPDLSSALNEMLSPELKQKLAQKLGVL